MHEILSFDVGLKNMAFCLISFDEDSKELEIKKWGIINIVKNNWVPDISEQKCLIKNKEKICNRKTTSYMMSDTGREELCEIHRKKVEPEKRKFLFPYENKNLKCCYCFKENKEVPANWFYFEGDEMRYGLCSACYKKNKKSLDKPLYKIKSFDKIDEMETYSRFFDLLMERDFCNVDEVIIENQPSLKNPRMKSIQVFLYSFFLINWKQKDILDQKKLVLFSASKKLELFFEKLICEEIKENEGDTDRKKYSNRKKNAVAISNKLIDNNEKWKTYFQKNPKKDDLADALVQGLTYLHSKYKFENVSLKSD